MRRQSIKLNGCMALSNNDTIHSIHKRAQHEDNRHSLERVWFIACREPSDPPPDRNYHAYAQKGITSTTSYSQGFEASLSAQPTPLGESLGWSNQRSPKTSQACYGHPRCNLNLVRLLRFSLPLPVFRGLFLFPLPRGHKPTAPFVYCAVPNPSLNAYSH